MSFGRQERMTGGGPSETRSNPELGFSVIFFHVGSSPFLTRRLPSFGFRQCAVPVTESGSLNPLLKDPPSHPRSPTPSSSANIVSRTPGCLALRRWSKQERLWTSFTGRRTLGTGTSQPTVPLDRTSPGVDLPGGLQRLQKVSSVSTNPPLSWSTSENVLSSGSSPGPSHWTGCSVLLTYGNRDGRRGRQDRTSSVLSVSVAVTTRSGRVGGRPL